MEESGSNIEGGHATPIQTSNTYVGLAQKTYNFASAADANYWAYLQGAPECRVFDNEGTQIASATCDYAPSGTNVTVTAIFDPRVNTAGATGINRTYYFRFVDIESDINPQGISIFH